MSQKARARAVSASITVLRNAAARGALPDEQTLDELRRRLPPKRIEAIVGMAELLQDQWEADPPRTGPLGNKRADKAAELLWNKWDAADEIERFRHPDGNIVADKVDHRRNPYTLTERADGGVDVDYRPGEITTTEAAPGTWDGQGIQVPD